MWAGSTRWGTEIGDRKIRWLWTWSDWQTEMIPSSETSQRGALHHTCATGLQSRLWTCAEEKALSREGKAQKKLKRCILAVLFYRNEDTREEHKPIYWEEIRGFRWRVMSPQLFFFLKQTQLLLLIFEEPNYFLHFPLSSLSCSWSLLPVFSHEWESVKK